MLFGKSWFPLSSHLPTLPQTMGDLRALAYSMCLINVGWLYEALNGREFGPKNRREDALMRKPLMAVVEDIYFFSCSALTLPPQDWAASRQERWFSLPWSLWCFAQSQAHNSCLITAFWMDEWVDEWDRVMWLRAHGHESQMNRTWNPRHTTFFWQYLLHAH